ncbi:bacteriohemerythrin [Dechloromonas sp. ZY10]|uniref:bacteriohemerythrin n=1 Tax=Dechloromonas aquae TaxID=2664436 RepID=UPI003529B0C4
MGLVWRAEMATGIRAVDLQHEELVAMINALAEAVVAQADSAALDALAQRLDAYIVFHFGTEENLMSTLPRGSEHVTLHRQQHREFVAELARLRQSGAFRELLSYLENWIVAHIMKTDRALALQLRQGGR